MHKLIILIESFADAHAFENLWPDFLARAEAMPGLRRETTSWPGGMIYGDVQIELIHELYFDSQEALKQAMESPPGQAAGQMLQRLTAGKMTLLIAHHLEDELENIRPYREAHHDPQ
ncbi:MAG: EthD family reductase [Anaerolineales bacterium]|jgi:uncharacterized protein (TIGR02118 family)